MKTQKMNLKNIKDTLSRDEMKKILAGSGSWSGMAYCTCMCNGHPGAWTGTYTVQAMEAAVAMYCDSQGANCQCNPI